MSSGAESPAQKKSVPSFAHGLFAGRIDEDLIFPFPQLDPDEAENLDPVGLGQLDGLGARVLVSILDERHEGLGAGAGLGGDLQGHVALQLAQEQLADARRGDEARALQVQDKGLALEVAAAGVARCAFRDADTAARWQAGRTGWGVAGP